MKLIIISLIIPGILTVVSCSNKTAKEQGKDTDIHSPRDSQQVALPKTPPDGPSPAAIQINRSEVSAEVIEIKQKGENDFSVTAKTLEVKDDPAYPSMATVNNIYELNPSFVFEENNKIADNQKNKNLMKLKHFKKGDSFKAIIFLNDNKHWMIQEVIDK